MTTANERQVGGTHYKQGDGGEEHWDRVARLGLDYFQACVTKYVERWKMKGGVQDLEKARHFLDKYIELVKADRIKSIDQSGKTTVECFTCKYCGALREWNQTYACLVHSDKLTTKCCEPAGVEDMIVKAESTDRVQIKRTGFIDFTYEGGTAEYDLFTCKLCNVEVRTKPNDNPYLEHNVVRCALAPNAEPTPAYVNQG